MLAEVSKYFLWIILGGTKILIAPSTMITASYTFWETWITVAIGGVLGTSLFYLGAVQITKLFKRLSNKPQRKFTWQNRLIVKTRKRFGAIGIALLIGILSIPIGSLVMSIYTKDKIKALSSLWLSVLIWDTLLCSISIGVKTGLF
jgi:hypothetical protein